MPAQLFHLHGVTLGKDLISVFLCFLVYKMKFIVISSLENCHED